MTAGVEWIESAEVHDGLQRLVSVLIESAASDSPKLSEMAGYLASLGGKRIRPALVLIAHGPGCTRAEALRAAATVELIHLASLHHDDIMDRGTLRRGAPSANAKWGNSAAMLTGTFLFLRAQSLVATLEPEARKLAAAAAAALCLGQLRESENAFDADLSPEAHLEILALKTGALFRLALQLGALLGKASALETEALVSYAHHFGLAFQLSDDLLDVEGDQAITGKDVLNDIRTGVYSLPWLLLLGAPDKAAHTVKQIFARRRLTSHDLADALHALKTSDALVRARARLMREIERAIDALRPVPDGPAHRSLSRLAETMSRRVR